MLIDLGKNEIHRSGDAILTIDNDSGVRMTCSEEQWRSMILSGTSNGNRICGRVYKGDKFWVAKLPALDLMTQGRTKVDAYAMVKDMLETLVNLPGFLVRVNPDEQGSFEVRSEGSSQWESAWNRHGSSTGVTASAADSA